MELILAGCDGDTATVRTLLSTAGAQSLINYQEDKVGATPLCFAAVFGQESVTKQLIEVHSNTDRRTKDGSTHCAVDMVKSIIQDKEGIPPD